MLDKYVIDQNVSTKSVCEVCFQGLQFSSSKVLWTRKGANAPSARLFNIKAANFTFRWVNSRWNKLDNVTDINVDSFRQVQWRSVKILFPEDGLHLKTGRIKFFVRNFELQRSYQLVWWYWQILLLGLLWPLFLEPVRNCICFTSKRYRCLGRVAKLHGSFMFRFQCGVI